MVAAKGHAYHPTLQKILDRVALNISQLRKEKKLTVDKAAARGQIHWRHWQKIESGEINLTMWAMVRIATALQADPSAFFAREPRQVQAKPKSKRVRRIVTRARARAAHG